MKKNIGTLDRIIRILIAIVIAILYFTQQINGITAVVLLIISATFIITSFIGFCPIYFPFKFSTKK